MPDEPIAEVESIQSPRVSFFLWIALAVLLLWFGTWVLFDSDPNRGTFGDMFGAVNALFSGLAFSALVFTLMHQRAELTMQRQELALTRKELSGQREQMEIQNKTLLLQRFEQTFFQLLNLHNQIVQAIDLDSESHGKTLGRDCFSVFVDRLKKQLKIVMPQQGWHSDESVRMAYGNFYVDNEANVGHYFRSLYNILKLVDRSALSAPEKRVYTNLVRAQLSNQELMLLFADGLSTYGVKMKPLIESYALLKHVDRKRLQAFGLSPHFYSHTAMD